MEGLGVSAPLPVSDFWRGRRVLLTGHTGFKGAWTALWLADMGAIVTGFALAPETSPALFDQASIGDLMESRIGDLRDRAAVTDAVRDVDPEVVIHMAAQPIVRRAIADPVETIAVNVLGTAHLLDALRDAPSLSTVLVVTSDKVYANEGAGRAFAEGDRLGGKDPYSASKAATELVAQSFAQTYFADRGVRLASARGGNVIGGGDYAEDRIIPDIVRAAMRDEVPVLRMPNATRPWQHVLDCVCGYLLFAEALAQARDVPAALNFGPSPGGAATVAELTETMLTALGQPSHWRPEPQTGSKEMTALAVDASLARRTLQWTDRLSGRDLVDWTANWYRSVHQGGVPRDITHAQIAAYCKLQA